MVRVPIRRVHGFTALAPNFWALVFLRALTGVAMGSEWNTGVAFLAETWPERTRPKGAGFLQSGFGWGTLLAALAWLVLGAWRPPGFAGSRDYHALRQADVLRIAGLRQALRAGQEIRATVQGQGGGSGDASDAP